MIHYLPTVRSNRQGFASLGKLASATKNLFADTLQADMSRETFSKPTWRLHWERFSPE